MFAETAIIFVEIRPHYFRAQYHATHLIKLLKRVKLQSDLQERLTAALAARRAYQLGKQSGPPAHSQSGERQ